MTSDALRGRIGPNAITRIADALERQVGHAMTADLFGSAGLAVHLEHPPASMVDEREACRLHGLMRARLGDAVGAAVAHEAGVATADYLLAHRIPRPVQFLLKRLPAALACRSLVRAISRHAWTFAGSGQFEAHAARPVLLTIRHNALCQGQHSIHPVCDYYAATFEQLFRVLVHPQARVTELTCEARGEDACRFQLCW